MEKILCKCFRKGSQEKPFLGSGTGREGNLAKGAITKASPTGTKGASGHHRSCLYGEGVGELERLYSQHSVRGTGIPQHYGWSGLQWGGMRVSGHLHTASERDVMLALESGHVLGALCKKTFQGLEGIRQGTGRRPLERLQFVEPRAGTSLGSRAGTGPRAGTSLGSRAGTGHRLAVQGA